MADKTLDVTGLNCPMPILKAKKALRDVPENGTLEVFATDPGSVADFEAFASATGNKLVETGEKDGVFRFVLKHTG